MRSSGIPSWSFIVAITAVAFVVGGGAAHAQTKSQKGTQNTPGVKVAPSRGLPWFVRVAEGLVYSQVNGGDDVPDGRAGGPPNDDCLSALTITDGVTPFSTIGATTDGLPSSLCDYTGNDQVGSDIWYDYTATCSQTLTASTCSDADFDTKIAIYVRSVCPAISIVACNDDGPGCAGFTSIAQANAIQGLQYKIRVGGYGAETGTGNLTITCGEVPDGPVNDNCADAITIFEGDTAFTNIDATMDGPDLLPECDEGYGVVLGSDVWFDYTPSVSGILTVETCDSDYDTRIAAYQECGCPVDNDRLVACNDDGCVDLTSSMEFPVNAGVCYKLRIGGWGTGSQGSGTIRITLEDAGACGDAVGDCCDPLGNGSAGCEDLACCLLVCQLDGFCCAVEWDSTCASYAAEACPLCGASTGPENDACVDAIPVSAGEYPFNTTDATMDGPELPPSCDEGYGLVLGSDIWYDFTPSASGVATIDVCDASHDSRVAVYEDCDCPVDNVRLVGCDDDGCGDLAGPSLMEFPVSVGTCYKLRIGGWGTSEQGNGTMIISIDDAPAPTPLASDPPDCAIDGRRPADLDSDCIDPLGWDAIDVTFDGDASGVLPSDFTITVDPPDVAPPVIVTIVPKGNTATLELDGIIPPGHWTTFTYAPSDPEWSTKIGYLPADVTGDGTSGPLDILGLIDFLNGVGPALEIWQTDIDRSDESNSADILGVIDLLNGAGCFDSWNGQTLLGDCG